VTKLKAKRRGRGGKSWYVDETYIKIQGQWSYLYRAIDRDGNLVDSMLSATRDLPAAKAFFSQAVATVGHKPERVTTDKHAAYPQAIQARLGFDVVHRTSQYLNNRIEQDHRAIKQRYYPMRGFGSFAGAALFCVAYDEFASTFVPVPPLTNRCHSLNNANTFATNVRSCLPPGKLLNRRESSPKTAVFFSTLNRGLSPDATSPTNAIVNHLLSEHSACGPGRRNKGAICAQMSSTIPYTHKQKSSTFSIISVSLRLVWLGLVT